TVLMAKEFKLSSSLSVFGNEDIAYDFLSRIWGKKGVFTCTIGNTMTSTIPGVSEAGDTPELTLFTPAADAEMLVNGRTTCMKGIPINPGGIPTPATLTMAALELSDMPLHIINGGCRINPYIPYYEVGGRCGEAITSGKSVHNVKECFERGKVLGGMLAKGHDFLVASESCAGGTTTALAVMMAMGVVTENLVSSSSPRNPRELKTRIVNESLNAANIKIGDLRDDPLKAIECVGDPMMPVNVGLIIGAAKHVPVIIGGGTQMAAVIAAVIQIDPSVIGNIVQGTTRWLVKDPNSDICRMIGGISESVPIVYINMDYSKSPYEGLQAYEWGFCKEGVGCGGASISAVISSSGKIDCDIILDKVHEVYKRILNI
ncbi:MAG: TIGR00303 family protein, partial [Candidatus Methanomethylophilaceae archaeon]